MMIIAGAAIVVICTFGGYVAMGGYLEILWQPFEVVIICGAALGGFMIANPPIVIKRTAGAIVAATRGGKHSKQDYMELLSLLYMIFKLSKTKGMLALEQHIENPDESGLFQQFPSVTRDERVMSFLRDYLRLMSLGTEDPHTLENLMEEEIETHHHEQARVAHAMQAVADTLPALGIVAAVLGIIKTMAYITEPPEVLGQLIGGALVGTFLGVWLSYGFAAPLARALGEMYGNEQKYYLCMKAGLLAHLHGYAPAVSVEFARKALFQDDRPDFYELEEATAALPPS